MTAAGATPFTVHLHGATADPAELGGKGAALDRLIGWGLHVPPTGVVTAHSYRAIAALPGPAALVGRLVNGQATSAGSGTALVEAEVDRAFAATRPPPELHDDIVALGRRIGAGCRVAVRSSATVEDLARWSFAGLYRSVLDVDPGDPDALVSAVMSVFASLWHPQARAYRREMGIDETDIAMAAVVMQMVPATRAGVVFTVDPADPSGRARVEAVDGLGESLVSGERTPDAWLLDPAAPDPGAPREIREALDAAWRIATLSGCPQDVEWAWDDGELWVVQARPITTGAHDDGDGLDSPITDADLTTAGIREMLPGVLPPLVWQVAAHLVGEAFDAVLDGLGLPLDDAADDRGLLRRVRGRAALDFSRLHRMASVLSGGAAEELEQEYFGSKRSGRPVAPAAPSGSRIHAARHDLRVLVQQHRATQDADIVAAAVAAVRRQRPDPTALDDDELSRYRYRLLDLGVRAMTTELACAATAAASYRRLELALAAHLDAAEAGRLAGAVTTGAIALPAADASAAVFAGPTWEETGREPPRPPAPVDRDDMVERLRERLSASPHFDADSPLSWLRWRHLQRIVETTVEQLGRRERTKVAVLELGGEVRRIHLEWGHRLTERGALERTGDVDLLTQEEIAAAFGGAPMPAGVVARRRRAMQRYEAEGPLPIRFTGRPDRRIAALPPGQRLEGWSASAGRCTARACYLSRPDEPLPDGGILLAEATDASWSPLFTRAGAIVLERGGPLSHAAILARELGVPAVLDVGTSVRLLHGAELTVDGDSGIVVVHAADHDDDGGER